MNGLMQGKRGLIMGLANDKSLAWGIAQQLHEQGAELAFSYRGYFKKARSTSETLNSNFLIECDVSNMEALDAAFDTLRAKWNTIDFVVHAIGFSDKKELRGKFVDTSLDNFLNGYISAYSLSGGKTSGRNDASVNEEAKVVDPSLHSLLGAEKSSTL